MDVYYVLGVDLGQANDPTAVVLLEYPLQHEPVYDVRFAYRFPLGTTTPSSPSGSPTG